MVALAALMHTPITIQQKNLETFLSLFGKGNRATCLLETLFRFWSRVKVPQNVYDCWEWQGYLQPNGYGQVNIRLRVFYVHRIAYVTMFGVPIVPDGEICHHCDNRKCCNPFHLFNGTRADNMMDCVSKGRHGRGNGRAVLTLAQREEIRRTYQRQSKDFGGVALAKKFGVSSCSIYALLKGETWKNG